MVLPFSLFSTRKLLGQVSCPCFVVKMGCCNYLVRFYKKSALGSAGNWQVVGISNEKVNMILNLMFCTGYPHHKYLRKAKSTVAEKNCYPTTNRMATRQCMATRRTTSRAFLVCPYRLVPLVHRRRLAGPPVSAIPRMGIPAGPPASAIPRMGTRTGPAGQHKTSVPQRPRWPLTYCAS